MLKVREFDIRRKQQQQRAPSIDDCAVVVVVVVVVVEKVSNFPFATFDRFTLC